MSSGRLGEFVARILTDFETDRIIDATLQQITCNVCGRKGLRRVPRVQGEPGFEKGKQKAVCASCGAQQWKPCDQCQGSGKVLQTPNDSFSLGEAECDKCGGSGLYGKAQTEESPCAACETLTVCSRHKK